MKSDDSVKDECSFCSGEYKCSLEQKFFFKGKFFDNKEDFIRHAKEWYFLEMDSSSFNREWEGLGQSLYMSLTNNNIRVTNGKLDQVLQIGLIFLLDKFVRHLEREEEQDER